MSKLGQEVSAADVLAEDSRARGPRRRTAVLPAVVATASVRVVASSGPIVVVVPSPADHIMVTLRLTSVAEAVVHRGALLAFGARAGSGRTEASLSYRGGAVGSSEAPPRRREAELSACCTAAVLRRSRSAPRTRRPSMVEGSGIARTSIAAAATFWLEQLKIGGCPLPLSLLMRRCTSWALRRALPPSPQPRCSCSRVSRSYCSRSWFWSTFA